MATFKSVNVTKYDAGADPTSNDLGEGYIKSVEKCWIDSYVITTALLSSTSLCIGYVPAGKKLVDVVVSLPIMNDEVATLGSVHLCTGETTAAGVIGTMKSDFEITDSFSMTTAQTLRMDRADMGNGVSHMKTSSSTAIFIRIQLIGETTAVTAGTIRSIIKYT